MAGYVAYFNGEFIPDSECKLHLGDRGIQKGDLVFDAQRTFNGDIFRLREHLERLYRSLTYLRLDPGLTIDEMEELTLEVVRRNEPLREPGSDYSVRQVVTRGRGVRVTDQVPPTVCIYVAPYDFTQYARFYKDGRPRSVPSYEELPHRVR